MIRQENDIRFIDNGREMNPPDLIGPQLRRYVIDNLR